MGKKKVTRSTPPDQSGPSRKRRRQPPATSKKRKASKNRADLSGGSDDGSEEGSTWRRREAPGVPANKKNKPRRKSLDEPHEEFMLMEDLLGTPSIDGSSEDEDVAPPRKNIPRNTFVEHVRPRVTHYRSNVQTALKELDKVKYKDRHRAVLKRTPLWLFFAGLKEAHYGSMWEFTKKDEKALRKVMLAFDKKTNCFVLGDELVRLDKRDAQLTFGICDGPKVIPHVGRGMSRPEWLDRCFDDSASLKSIGKKDCLDKIKKLITSHDPEKVEDVARLTHMYLLGCVLAPNRGATCPWYLAAFVEDIDTMSHYDWSTYIVEHLVKSLSETETQFCGGAIMLLAYWLCEHTNLVDPIDPELFPRFLRWDLNMLYAVLKRLRVIDIPPEQIMSNPLRPTKKEKKIFEGLVQYRKEERAKQLQRKRKRDVESTSEELDDEESSDGGNVNEYGEPTQYCSNDEEVAESDDDDMCTPVKNGGGADIEYRSTADESSESENLSSPPRAKRSVSEGKRPVCPDVSVRSKKLKGYRGSDSLNPTPTESTLGVTPSLKVKLHLVGTTSGGMSRTSIGVGESSTNDLEALLLKQPNANAAAGHVTTYDDVVESPTKEKMNIVNDTPVHTAKQVPSSTPRSRLSDGFCDNVSSFSPVRLTFDLGKEHATPPVVTIDSLGSLTKTNQLTGFVAPGVIASPTRPIASESAPKEIEVTVDEFELPSFKLGLTQDSVHIDSESANNTVESEVVRTDASRLSDTNTLVLPVLSHLNKPEDSPVKVAQLQAKVDELTSEIVVKDIIIQNMCSELDEKNATIAKLEEQLVLAQKTQVETKGGDSGITSDGNEAVNSLPGPSTQLMLIEGLRKENEELAGQLQVYVNPTDTQFFDNQDNLDKIDCYMMLYEANKIISKLERDKMIADAVSRRQVIRLEKQDRVIARQREQVDGLQLMKLSDEGATVMDISPLQIEFPDDCKAGSSYRGQSSRSKKAVTPGSLVKNIKNRTRDNKRVAKKKSPQGTARETLYTSDGSGDERGKQLPFPKLKAHLAAVKKTTPHILDILKECWAEKGPSCVMFDSPGLMKAHVNLWMCIDTLQHARIGDFFLDAWIENLIALYGPTHSIVYSRMTFPARVWGELGIANTSKYLQRWVDQRIEQALECEVLLFPLNPKVNAMRGATKQHGDHWVLLKYDVPSDKWSFYNSIPARAGCRDAHFIESKKLIVYVEGAMRTVYSRKMPTHPLVARKPSDAHADVISTWRQTPNSLDCGVVVGNLIELFLLGKPAPPSGLYTEMMAGSYRAKMVSWLVDSFNVDFDEWVD